MKQEYFHGKVRNADRLPQGYYVFDRELGMPRLVDEEYDGFKIVWERGEPEARSGIQVITDAIEVKSLNDGKVYTSKKKYYDSLKATGSHVTESGELKGRRKEIHGDFNVKRELRQALQQHLGR